MNRVTGQGDLADWARGEVGLGLGDQADWTSVGAEDWAKGAGHWASGSSDPVREVGTGPGTGGLGQ